MLPILGRPLLAYTFDQLKAGRMERAILSCGHLPDEIEEYFGDNFDGHSSSSAGSNPSLAGLAVGFGSQRTESPRRS
jgi:NDP-sugar pyrophosphorylase family protein